MTIQQLKYIVAIDQFRHFGKAAEAMDLNQSTLSLMVKKLEDELDLLIFDRDSYPISPTEIGRKVIDQAKVVLYNVNQLLEITKSEKQSTTGPLKIAMISTVAPVLVPGLFKYLSKNHPGISLISEEMPSNTILEKLSKAEVDMGIMAEPVSDPNLLTIPLFHEKFFAYADKGQKNNGGTITIEALRRGKVWVMKDGLQLFDESMSEGDSTFSYDRFYEGSRVGILVQMVNENGGMTIIPQTHINLIRPGDMDNILEIVDSELKRTIVIAIRRDYIHEGMLNAVLHAVRAIIPNELLDDLVKAGDLAI